MRCGSSNVQSHSITTWTRNTAAHHELMCISSAANSKSNTCKSLITATLATKLHACAHVSNHTKTVQAWHSSN